jgi:hypothetical protein
VRDGPSERVCSKDRRRALSGKHLQLCRHLEACLERRKLEESRRAESRFRCWMIAFGLRTEAVRR